MSASVIDWVTRRNTEDQPRGIMCTLFSTLEDLDITEDIALLSPTHCHMQEKTSRLRTYVGLNINPIKTEVMILNTPNPQPVKVDGEDLPMIEQFTSSSFFTLLSSLRNISLTPSPSI